MDEEIKELTRQRDIYQSRLETLLQSGKHPFLGDNKYSNPSDQDLNSGDLPENPNRPMSDVVLNNEDHEWQVENPEPKLHLVINTPRFVRSDKIASRASVESEDSCKEVQCIDIEEVKTCHQTDDESSIRRKDGSKLNHVVDDDSPNALKQKIHKLLLTTDHLVGLSEKSYESSESPFAISRNVPSSRNKSCKPNLATTSSQNKKIDRESISSDMSSSKLDVLEQETNALAVKAVKECSVTSVRIEDKVSAPKLHTRKRKSHKNRSRIHKLVDSTGEVESVMDSDTEDTASVLNYAVKMKTRSKEAPPLKKDFDDLMVSTYTLVHSIQMYVNHL